MWADLRERHSWWHGDTHCFPRSGSPLQLPRGVPPGADGAAVHRPLPRGAGRRDLPRQRVRALTALVVDWPPAHHEEHCVTVHPIRLFGDPVLRTAAVEVTDFD